MRGTITRSRYFVFASVMYALLGIVIAVRAVEARAPIPIVLGLIFLALGLVRLRDYWRWRGNNG
jgi:uncharacterized membrane protein HdeD (DUF308 family)